MTEIINLILHAFSTIYDYVYDRRAARVKEYIFPEKDVLEKNEALLSNKLEVENLQSAIWFMPSPSFPFPGGILSIFRFAEILSKQENTVNTFVFKFPIEASIHKHISDLFPELEYKISSNFDLEKSAQEEFDIGICVFWFHAFDLLKFNHCKRKFYYIQDDENEFYSSGIERHAISEVLKFKFDLIVNSHVLKKKYESLSSSEVFYYPLQFNQIFNRKPASRNRSPNHTEKKVLVYFRPGIARNYYQLILKILEESYKKYGQDIRFTLVGAKKFLWQFSIPKNSQIISVNSYSKLQDLYDKHSLGLIFISTPTCSLQQLDFIEANIPFITNVNEEFQSRFDTNGVIFVDLKPIEIVTTIKRFFELEQKPSHDNFVDNANFIEENLVTFLKRGFKNV